MHVQLPTQRLFVTYTHTRSLGRPRCDPNALCQFAALRTSPEARASVHILFVVDDPSSPNLPQIQALADYSPNHHIRITVMSANEGASQARNAGMAQSFGDWTVLVGGGWVGMPSRLALACVVLAHAFTLFAQRPCLVSRNSGPAMRRAWWPTHPNPQSTGDMMHSIHHQHTPHSSLYSWTMTSSTWCPPPRCWTPTWGRPCATPQPTSLWGRRTCRRQQASCRKRW